jgi:hypothetical protein
MTDIDLSKIEQKNLQKLIDMEKPDVFGASFVKRYLLLGQDRALSLIERGLIEGKLIKVATDNWEEQYRLPNKTAP